MQRSVRLSRGMVWKTVWLRTLCPTSSQETREKHRNTSFPVLFIFMSQTVRWNENRALVWLWLWNVIFTSSILIPERENSKLSAKATFFETFQQHGWETRNWCRRRLECISVPSQNRICVLRVGVLLCLASRCPTPRGGLALSPSALWWDPLGEWQPFIVWIDFIFTKVVDLKLQFVQKERASVSCPPLPTPTCSLTLHSALHTSFHFLNYMLSMLFIIPIWTLCFDGRGFSSVFCLSPHFSSSFARISLLFCYLSVMGWLYVCDFGMWYVCSREYMII